VTVTNKRFTDSRLSQHVSYSSILVGKSPDVSTNCPCTLEFNQIQTQTIIFRLLTMIQGYVIL